jgi:2-polyprenyl-6-methoxyphenol hydroxylase-like FAD-dependent oxidoreductase
VTIVERAPTLRNASQGVDVRDTARDVIKRMGIFDRVRDKNSQEEGLKIVDCNNRCFASFGVDKSGKGDSITSDIEILRGELAGILFDVTKDDVSYVFGDMVESLEETDKEVGVNFANGTPTTAFDLVVAADGIGSKIRDMTFGNDSSHVKSLDSYVSYFSIPKGDTDTMWSRVHWVKGGSEHGDAT